jgi:ectoine hydroxylase-related dioxygenase (phytanoyl-CoA dioxygenase family)
LEKREDRRSTLNLINLYPPYLNPTNAAINYDHLMVLTQEQIDTFVRDGVLVVDNILTAQEVASAKHGLHQTLLHYNVDSTDLPNTAHNLQKLSSTNGSGGVLDIFYPRFKMDIATHERLFRATQQLWEAALAHDGQSEEEMISMGKQEAFHPFGKFDIQKGYMYIDRLGYRIPTMIAEEIGAKLDANEDGNTTRAGSYNRSKKKQKKTAIQRSLTPHLDCCPDTFYSTDKKSKWRPIQCFVSLTDNLDPNTGGFEAAPGFHREFHRWRKERKPSTITKMDKIVGIKVKQELPAPCIGEYTHIRPVEDEDVMKSIRHIPVRAGSAVFWDNRIPHANSYRNDSDTARAVVYCSFLPDVPLNRQYAEKQLEDYLLCRKPRDTWIHVGEDGDNSLERKEADDYAFSYLGRKLMKLDEW